MMDAGGGRVRLPSWLQALLKGYGARYEKSGRSMVCLYDDDDELRRYLGTYFPRSYAEGFAVFSRLAEVLGPLFAGHRPHVCDICCGTGGELFGMLQALGAKGILGRERGIDLVGIDGNRKALLLLSDMMGHLAQCNVDFEPCRLIVERQSDLADIEKVLSGYASCDLAICSKAINEFVQLDRFPGANPYRIFARHLAGCLRQGGFLLIMDLNLKFDGPEKWLGELCDAGLREVGLIHHASNTGNTETIWVDNPWCPNVMDKSKIIWRLFSK